MKDAQPQEHWCPIAALRRHMFVAAGARLSVQVVVAHQ
jgi:hypothetical protein